MTDPSQFGDNPDFPPPQTSYPPPGYLPPPSPGGYQRPMYADPSAPYGRHPLTGEPLSDKSKVIAGLLQLLGIIGFVGIGRLYLGYTGLGIAQLIIGFFVGGIVGFLTCGVGFLIPVVWGVVEAILILTDKIRDPMGRPLGGT